MKCGKSLSKWLFVCWLLLALPLAGISQDQPAPGESTSSLSPSSGKNGRAKSDTSWNSGAPSSEPGNNLSETWQKFKQKYQDFTLSLEQYLDQVEAFGISFEDLPLYLTYLEESLTASEAARARERAEALEGRQDMIEALAAAQAARERAERERDQWRAAAVISSGLVLAGIITGLVIILK